MRKKILIILLGLAILLLGGGWICIRLLAASFQPATPSGKQGGSHESIVRDSEPLPYKRWWFEIFTPEYLPASVSYALFYDEDKYIFQIIRPDNANQDYGSMNTWNKRLGSASGGIKNYGEALPRALTICWDSIIDKKSYQTVFYFTSEVWQLMREPAAGRRLKEHTFYRNTIFIGLAPGGTARAWLRGYDKNNGDNILIATGKSFSDDEMPATCKGKTKHSDGYGEYSEEIKTFIEGKEYPYGKW
ncbi:DUF2931 family protein [Xenorhabdus sp. Vera]|uniref:DUF2931 family protein n=1 Tax=Xenorhabdus koppenhoeferi TaxID=351659 RepID=UPI0019C0E311|nr:DUF2931 family protein [Xenorhabdus sp. Vera]MBD2812445.1 DUF2931 family protein [Xenorhabdus sp. Vera]